MKDIIDRLNYAKKQKGLTLKALSEKSGISLGTINKIMSGSLQKIKPEKLQKLAEALDVTAEYLSGKTEKTIARATDNYGLCKIACISPEVKIGDCTFNGEQIVAHAKKAAADGVKIAVFPELCITGYCCGDLFFQSALRNAALETLKTVAEQLTQIDITVIVGLPVCADSGKLYNAAAVVLHGEILGIVPKVNLANYNEFSEKRMFTPYEQSAVTTVRLFGKDIPFGSKLIFANNQNKEIRFSVEICEDVWTSNSPSVAHANAGANAVFNLSASNESIVKDDYRRKMIEIQSAKSGIIYAYCSAGMSESTSQTVFSAHNIICENGEILDEALPFGGGYAEAACDFDFIANERARLDHVVSLDNYLVIPFDLDIGYARRVYCPTPFVPQNKRELAARCEKALTILAYGLKKRIEHVNAQKLVIGLSGGSDSTLALITCLNALKLLNRPSDDVLAVTMPCFGTSARTLTNAVNLANAYGVTLKQIDISKSVTQHLKDIDHSLKVTDVTYENAQARERTQVLMDIANDVNGLVIGTGDMSELALGWATYNGDHMSMYGVNSSVPKTLVKALIKYQASKSESDIKRILEDILDTPISPELLPLNTQNEIAQKTENTVGPYELHDYFLYMLIRKGFSPSKVYTLAKESFADKYDAETIYKWLEKFIWRFFTQQYKRSCTPDGVKLGSVDLSKMHFRMASDVTCASWIADLEKVSPEK